MRDTVRNENAIMIDRVMTQPVFEPFTTKQPAVECVKFCLNHSASMDGHLRLNFVILFFRPCGITLRNIAKLKLK